MSVVATEGFLQLNHNSKAVQCQGLFRTSSLCTSNFEATLKVNIPLKPLYLVVSAANSAACFWQNASNVKYLNGCHELSICNITKLLWKASSKEQESGYLRRRSFVDGDLQMSQAFSGYMGFVSSLAFFPLSSFHVRRF